MKAEVIELILTWEPPEEELATTLVNAGSIPEHYDPGHIPGFWRKLLNTIGEIWQ